MAPFRTKLEHKRYPVPAHTTSEPTTGDYQSLILSADIFPPSYVHLRLYLMHLEMELFAKYLPRTNKANWHCQSVWWGDFDHSEKCGESVETEYDASRSSLGFDRHSVFQHSDHSPSFLGDSTIHCDPGLIIETSSVRNAQVHDESATELRNNSRRAQSIELIYCKECPEPRERIKWI
jgi:hypothetical protein